MSMLVDPTGAPFCLWQSRSPDAGDFVMFEDHAIGWVELASRDAVAARDFYVALLGWECEYSKVSMPGGIQYTEYGVGGVRYGGILPMTAEWGEMPSHWSIYVQVPDADACTARATELGGQVSVPAFDAPGVGRIARIDDPTGAGLYVIRLLRS
jgi:predicted enzyme related to lactoylglutathione lyase